ncbi:unnamed protein product [Oncorhynchus mykiss]|uniref:Uncharacterized protein n=1 Tax=Oncorhynchus mykiss TaxID=8022 RepID=A0A060YB90_ONCMY|nr:unnamed protein product [Oncorhynchus mykiss]
MNPVYSPVQPGTPYGNPKNMAYAGYPAGYAQTPTYTPNLYQTGSPGYPPGKNTHKQKLCTHKQAHTNLHARTHKYATQSHRHAHKRTCILFKPAVHSIPKVRIYTRDTTHTI